MAHRLLLSFVSFYFTLTDLKTQECSVELAGNYLEILACWRIFLPKLFWLRDDTQHPLAALHSNSFFIALLGEHSKELTPSTAPIK